MNAFIEYFIKLLANIFIKQLNKNIASFTIIFTNKLINRFNFFGKNKLTPSEIIIIKFIFKEITRLIWKIYKPEFVELLQQWFLY
jgi:hypothetical protein